MLALAKPSFHIFISFLLQLFEQKAQQASCGYISSNNVQLLLLLLLLASRNGF